MHISKARIAFYLLTFQKEKIPDYLLEVGNNWVVNELADGTKERVRACLEAGEDILVALSRHSDVCPEKWRTAYDATVEAFRLVVEACKDLRLTKEESSSVASSFKIAYSEWCAD